ncbi:MAG: hypothetical protein JST50_12750 [Bacteroidetes bacterium]|nr:hypothetical protein [Bacteroidota bacterium]
MNKDIYTLTNIGPDDISIILTKVQRSFNIRLDNKGLKDVDSFGSLCELIVNKLTDDHTENWSAQHAFYKVRSIISAISGVGKCDIKPHTKLSSILSADQCQRVIATIEDELDIKLNALQPKQWIIGLSVFTFVSSVIVCFYNLPIGATGMLCSAISLLLMGNFGKEIHLKTAGDLAAKVSREINLKTKRNNYISNKIQVEQKLKELFAGNPDSDPLPVTWRSNY